MPLQAFFLDYNDVVGINKKLGKTSGKFVVKYIRENMKEIAANHQNIIIDPGIRITNEIFEELLFSPLDDLTWFNKYKNLLLNY